MIQLWSFGEAASIASRRTDRTETGRAGTGPGQAAACSRTGHTGHHRTHSGEDEREDERERSRLAGGWAGTGASQVNRWLGTVRHCHLTGWINYDLHMASGSR